MIKKLRRYKIGYSIDGLVIEFRVKTPKEIR